MGHGLVRAQVDCLVRIRESTPCARLNVTILTSKYFCGRKLLTTSPVCKQKVLIGRFRVEQRWELSTKKHLPLFLYAYIYIYIYIYICTVYSYVPGYLNDVNIIIGPTGLD